MGKIKGWKKLVDDQYTSTGGGFDYFVTLYRNEKDPSKQIEILHAADRWGKRARPSEYDSKPVGLNIGIRYYESKEDLKLHDDTFDWIQGNYTFVESYKTLAEAKKVAMKYMRANPNG